jgi:hypothetical protein
VPGVKDSAVVGLRQGSDERVHAVILADGTVDLEAVVRELQAIEARRPGLVTSTHSRFFRLQKRAVTFAAGETNKTISIVINGDTLNKKLSAPDGDVYVDKEVHSIWRIPRIGGWRYASGELVPGSVRTNRCRVPAASSQQGPRPGRGRPRQSDRRTGPI